VWGNEDELPPMNARKNIMKQLISLIDNKEGFTVRMIGENPFLWEVKMFDFGDTLIGRDLISHAEKFNTKNVITFRMLTNMGRKMLSWKLNLRHCSQHNHQ
jgi:hypothetical protein